MAPPKLAGAVRAAAALEIASVRLISFSALTSYDAFDALPSNVMAKVGFTTPKVRVAGPRVAIKCTFLFRLLPNEGPPAVDLRATTELVYVRNSKTPIEATDLDEFALVNAPFNAWAYWREFVQTALSRMNLPAFAIPLFRIADARSMIVPDDQ